MENIFGVRAHDLLAKSSPGLLVNALETFNFKKVQLVIPKCFEPYSYEPSFIKEVKESLATKRIEVVMLGAYFNPVHSSLEVREKGIQNFRDNIKIAKEFNHPLIGSETGSYNDSPWIYVPKNRTEEGYQASKEVFLSLAKEALEAGERISIEPAFGHVMYSVPVFKRLLDEINLPNVFATIDLYNLLDSSNFAHRDEIFLEALKTFQSKIKIIHLKDAKLIEGKLVQLAPGQGDFHYQTMFAAIRKYCPDATCVFEGVKPLDMPGALSYCEKIFC